MRAPDSQLKVLKEKQGSEGDVCPMQMGSPVQGFPQAFRTW